jgi:asparagine synthase (glutamine-hydrolysing)
MCGILGLISEKSGKSLGNFSKALDTLTHRGPDDRGVFDGQGVLLGHRRLSVIDLSSGGHQPMRDSASGAVIVFNGEIYNYLELRVQLEIHGHVFRTKSDTEVLLHAYLEWGAAALEKLNGMWAFAIWRPDQRKLFIARDRFGVKPLYYTEKPGYFAFASEPKGLLALFPDLRKPDNLAVYEFLAQGQLYSNVRSFYQDVDVFPQGHYREYFVDTGQVRTTRYWDYPDAHDTSNGKGLEAIEEFSALFDDAVKLRTRSDVPVGITLSGGLDSTAVLAAARRKTSGAHVCFTSVYGDNDRGESEWAKIAAEPYGMLPVEVEAGKDDWLDTLRQISWHMDGPGYSPAVYPLWYLMREARKRGVLVLLEGQGADEALGGYPQYAIIAFLTLLKKAGSISGLKRAGNSWSNLCATFTAKWALLWLIRESFPALIEYNRRHAGASMTLKQDFRADMEKQSNREGGLRNSLSNPGYSPVNQRLLLDHSRNILPGLLHYGDAISMAHGVESRLPFLDYRLVEWIFANGDDVKIREGHTKWVLRQYLQNAGQARIAERKDKMGYPTPIEKWLSENNGAAVRELLLTPEARIAQFCDPRGIRMLLDRHLAGRVGAGSHLYRLVSTESWLRSCL